jgi:hypothetical protein
MLEIIILLEKNVTLMQTKIVIMDKYFIFFF